MKLHLLSASEFGRLPPGTMYWWRQDRSRGWRPGVVTAKTYSLLTLPYDVTLAEPVGTVTAPQPGTGRASLELCSSPNVWPIPGTLNGVPTPSCYGAAAEMIVCPRWHQPGTFSGLIARDRCRDERLNTGCGRGCLIARALSAAGLTERLRPVSARNMPVSTDEAVSQTTTLQASALAALRVSPGLTVTELASRIRLATQGDERNLRNTLARLSGLGLVRSKIGDRHNKLGRGYRASTWWLCSPHDTAKDSTS